MMERPTMRRKSSASNLLSGFKGSSVSSASIAGSGSATPLPTSASGTSIGPPSTTPTSATPLSREWDAQSLHSDTVPSAGAGVAAGTSVDYLRDMVHKRMQTLTYLRSIHMGQTHWINTILPTRQELEKVFNNNAMRKRTYRFAILGMSLANAFDVQPAQDFLKGLIATLADFDQFQDGNYKPKIRLFRSSKLPKRQTGGINDYALPIPDPGETSYLLSPHMPFPLDYHQTLLSLIDILSEVYQKISRILGPSPFATSNQMGPLGIITPYPGVSYLFDPNEHFREGDGSLCGIAYGFAGTSAMYGGALGSPPPAWNASWAEMLNKIDGKFKKIITTLTKELDAFARNSIKDELASLDPLLRNMAASDFSKEQYDFEGVV
ncbi:hypothetical protein SISSUDRAFT_1013307 [Sistotremastrum suecicum HHB10207 ss-3]|uniref:Uncharacterized protein n=1 Tax=Sistotremastrum suecicum HHB10207 ss-3 TaxID=1314776 RepID=A0A166IYV4_9AGAM|nr:hypothetical protein SISSUDRAFT_1013307 [Sistotremastrum suecicum HHB10207 ss-3]